MGAGYGIERINPFSETYQALAAKRPREHYRARYREIFEAFPRMFEALGRNATRDYYTELFQRALDLRNAYDPWVAWANALHLGRAAARLSRGLLGYWDDQRVKLGLREPGMQWRLGENIAISPKETIYSSELLRVYHFLPSPDSRTGHPGQGTGSSDTSSSGTSSSGTGSSGTSSSQVTTKRHRRPFFMLYSWINAYWILDLTPETSMLGALTDAGVETYVTDWQRPATEEGLEADLDTYIQECLAAMEAVRSHSGEDTLVVGGYCIGGVLADILVAMDPARVAALVNLTTGIDTYAGEDGAGAFGAFTSFEIADLGSFAQEHGGLLPQKSFGEFFDHVKPEKAVKEFMDRYVHGADASDDPISYWNRRSGRPAYPVHLEFLRRIYNDNELADGPADGSPFPLYAGRPVDLKAITIPIQVICGRFDHIVPLPVALRTCHLVGTPPKDQEVLVVKGGHVRSVVNLDLYPHIVDFVTRHAGPRDRDPRHQVAPRRE